VTALPTARSAAAEPGTLAARVLDGAERAFARFGVRACTVDLIAKEAGVSRVTAYRHVGTKEEIFRQVVLRNTRSYFGALEEDFARARSLDDVVEAVFTRAQHSFRQRDLYQTLLELEPETVLRMMTLGAGSFYQLGIPFLAPHMGPYLEPGADAEAAAEWVIRVTISAVGTAGHLIDPYDEKGRRVLAEHTVRGLPARRTP